MLSNDTSQYVAPLNASKVSSALYANDSESQLHNY